MTKEIQTKQNVSLSENIINSFENSNMLSAYLPEKQDQIKFLSSIKTLFVKDSNLLKCSKESIQNTLFKCVEYKLFPNGISGEAFILPYKKKIKKNVDGKEEWGEITEAQFQLGYQGIITLLGRAGYNITSKIVYKNDVFDYEEGLEPKLIHKPNLANKGDAIAVYAISIDKNKQKQFIVLSKKEIMEFKEFSKSKDSKYSPWTNDPQLYMWRKTAIKQLSKLLYKEENEDIIKAIDEDNQDSIISEKKETLNEKIDTNIKDSLKLKNKTEEEEYNEILNKEENENLPDITC